MSQPDWVSKTDIINYYRCPYAFWLIDTGQASVEEVRPELLRIGEEFEESVLSEMVPAPRKAMAKLFAEDHWLYNMSFLKNRDLRIWGRPDGVHTAGGALEPIEIKSHSRVTASDRLELAFYWLLFASFRTLSSASPTGFVQLRNDSPTPRRVTLRPRDFTKVSELIRLVRRARRQGVQPRCCRCEICSERAEVKYLSKLPRLEDLYGLGRYADALKDLRVSTLGRLMASDSVDITQRLRKLSLSVSPGIVDGWKAQARAWKLKRPIGFGDGRLGHSRFILLDLEYDCLDASNGHIWLTGIHIRNGHQKTIQIWSREASQQGAAMDELLAVLLKYPQLPILTWGGQSAELPQLRALAKALPLERLMNILRERHIDVFQFASQNVGLPVSSYRLKEVAQFFGFRTSTEIRNGFDLTMKYREFCRTRNDARRKTLRKEIEAYNRDDLMGLSLVVNRLCELTASV